MVRILSEIMKQHTFRLMTLDNKPNFSSCEWCLNYRSNTFVYWNRLVNITPSVDVNPIEWSVTRNGHLRHALQFVIGYLSSWIWTLKKITSCSLMYHFTVCMKRGGNQNNDASMPMEVILCFKGKGSLFPSVSLTINRFHVKVKINVARHSFQPNFRSGDVSIDAD